MRVVQWHGWLLDGSGSNVYTARVTESLRRRGHDVLLLCQERGVNRYRFVDAWGTVSDDGVSELASTGTPAAAGRAVLLRPEIGTVLPVFVVDEYEGFEVKRFVDLTDHELAEYIDRNVAALRAAIEWHGADVVVTGHAIPGAVIGARGAGRGRYVAKVHGSDLEYAVRLDPRLRELAREGLGGAAAVVGASDDVLRRAVELVPGSRGKTLVVPPGVDERFRPMPRAVALEWSAAALDTDPEVGRGRTAAVNAAVRAALDARDAAALHELAGSYDQSVPDPGAAAALRSLARTDDPLVAFFGKLIPQKGVHLFLQSVAIADSQARAIVVGFGGFREWLQALLLALDAGDPDVVAWIAAETDIDLELTADQIRAAAGIAERITFTGRLDHRYAPGVLAASEILVVPSILDEAFGIVAVEGAAAGAIPLVARHSGLAEIARVIETAIGHPSLCSFDPSAGSVERIATSVEEVLNMPSAEREAVRNRVAEFATREWSWDHTADLLLNAQHRSTM